MAVRCLISLVLIALGISAAHAGDVDPRLTHLNDQLIEWDLENYHQIHFHHGNGRDNERPVEPETNDYIPFVVSGEPGLNGEAGSLEIEPLGMRSLSKNFSFTIGLKVQSSDVFRHNEEYRAKRVASGKQTALESDLKGLVPDPIPLLSVSIRLHFDEDWTHGEKINSRFPRTTAQTHAQMLRILRVDLALERLRSELGDRHIQLETGLTGGGAQGSGGGLNFIDVAPSMYFKLKLPKAVSPLQAYVTFYRLLFKGMLEPKPPELAPPPSQAQRAFAGVRSLLARKRESCVIALDPSRSTPLQLEGPKGRGLAISNKSVVGPAETMITIETPLGPLEFLVPQAKPMKD